MNFAKPSVPRYLIFTADHSTSSIDTPAGACLLAKSTFMDAQVARMTGMWTTGCGGHDGQGSPQHNVTFFAMATGISHRQSCNDFAWSSFHENVQYA